MMYGFEARKPKKKMQNDVIHQSMEAHEGTRKSIAFQDIHRVEVSQ